MVFEVVLFGAISICLYDIYDSIYQTTWGVSPFDFFLTKYMVNIVFALWEGSFLSSHISTVMNGNLGTTWQQNDCIQMCQFSMSVNPFTSLPGEYTCLKLHHL